jgi:hypothetical protein
MNEGSVDDRAERLRNGIAIQEAERKQRLAQERAERISAARTVLAQEYGEQFARKVETTKEHVLHVMETAFRNGTVPMVEFESSYMKAYMDAWLVINGFITVPHTNSRNHLWTTGQFDIVPI